MKTFKLITLCTIFCIITACGQTGKLYLPEKEQATANALNI